MIYVYCVLLIFSSPKLYVATFPIIVLISFHPNISIWYSCHCFFLSVCGRQEGGSTHRPDVRCHFQKFLTLSFGLSNSLTLGPASQNGRDPAAATSQEQTLQTLVRHQMETLILDRQASYPLSLPPTHFTLLIKTIIRLKTQILWTYIKVKEPEKLLFTLGYIFNFHNYLYTYRNVKPCVY